MSSKHNTTRRLPATLSGLPHAVPLLIVLVAYYVVVRNDFWMFPVTSDGLAFCYYSAFPGKATTVFERFIHLYTGRLLTWPFDDLLEGYAFVSFFYHAGVVVCAFLIGRKLAGGVQGLLAAMFTTLFPLFFLRATEFLSDAPCLFFGLWSFYFSLFGRTPVKYTHLKILLSGFLLACSIFSKTFGIVFIIPVLLNLWPVRSPGNAVSFIAGGAGAVLFMAICDHIWLGDFYYHIDYANYRKYLDLVNSKLTQLADPGRGRPLNKRIFDPWFFAYVIFFLVFLFQGARILEFKRGIDWKKKGSCSLSLVGIGALCLFTQTSYSNPGWRIQYNYLYCMFVPWIIAFCSVVEFAGENGPEEPDGRVFTRPFIYMLILSVLYVFLIFITGSLDYNQDWSGSIPSLERFIYLGSFWIFLFSIVCLVAAGARLGKNGFGKTAGFVFLLGACGIIWHNAIWANSFSHRSPSETLYRDVKTFLREYSYISSASPITPVRCYVKRAREIRTYLLLTKLESKETLAFFRHIKKNGGWDEIFSSGETPFYLLTTYKLGFLEKKAGPRGLRVSRLTANGLHGCSFFLVRDAAVEPSGGPDAGKQRDEFSEKARL